MTVEFVTNWKEKCIESFDEMGLSEDLLRGIYGYCHESPSAIQQVSERQCCGWEKRALSGGQQDLLAVSFGVRYSCRAMTSCMLQRAIKAMMTGRDIIITAPDGGSSTTWNRS